jgi:hypothetical protein
MPVRGQGLYREQTSRLPIFFPEEHREKSIIPVKVYDNNNLVGNFTADDGYIHPGPEYISCDITGLLLAGVNEINTLAAV